MQPGKRNIIFFNIKLMILLVIISGCASPESSLNEQQPDETPAQVNMTALDPAVMVSQLDGLPVEIIQGESASIQIDDRIEVDPDGRGLLNVSDLIEIELFRNAQVSLADVRFESGGSVFVRLFQHQGHIRVSLDEGAPIQLTLETEDSTIRTLEDGTVFNVCKAPDRLTCLEVQKGSLESTAQSKTEIIREGEATYILKDQPPNPAICAPVEVFIAWEGQMRQSADTPPLSQLVADLPQESCSAPASEASNLPGSEGMVKIEYGTYEVGRDKETEDYSSPQTVALDNYWIDIYEVTNASYQEYLEQTGDQPPTIWPGEAAAYPVMGVTWQQAASYCTWENKRLPSEAEWEAAGRGPGSNPPLYPWGPDPNAGGSFAELPQNTPYAVGSYEFNKSQSGVYDLVGNVWEWVGEPYAEVQEGNQMLRGGRYGIIYDLAYRFQVRPDDSRYIQYAGFRCAADVVEE